MQLRRIAALEREKIESEYRELQETIAELEALLADPEKVSAEVARETEELKKKVRGARRTQIAGEAQEFSREELEAHERVVVTLSQGGYIKRIPASTYRNQHRGGKGVYSMRTREDDPVRHILVGDTHDTVLFFTNTGRVLSTRSYELRADVSRNTRGVPVANVVPLSDREHVNASRRRAQPAGGGPVPRPDHPQGDDQAGGAGADLEDTALRADHHEPEGRRRARDRAPGQGRGRRDRGHRAGHVDPLPGV